MFGIAIDVATGGMYALTADEVVGHLPSAASTEVAGNSLSLAVVLVQRGDPRWTRVGVLARR